MRKDAGWGQRIPETAYEWSALVELEERTHESKKAAKRRRRSIKKESRRR